MRAEGVLDKRSPIPLYFQLKTLLLERIQAGELKPNDQLPPESEIAAAYDVSKATVRQALGELVSAGLVLRVQGRGTFVAEPRVEQGPRELTSFTLEMSKRGHAASSRVLDKSVVAADDELAERLNVPAASPLFRLERLRLADGEPMGLQTAFVPLELVDGILEQDFTGKSLYGVLQTHYGLAPAQAIERHFAVVVNARQAALLGIAAGSPALAAERVALLPGGRPLEFTRSVMRGDRYSILLELFPNGR